MDNLPANSRFLAILIATIIFFLPTNGIAGVQDDFFWAIDKDNLSQASELIKKALTLMFQTQKGTRHSWLLQRPVI